MTATSNARREFSMLEENGLLVAQEIAGAARKLVDAAEQAGASAAPAQFFDGRTGFGQHIERNVDAVELDGNPFRNPAGG